MVFVVSCSSPICSSIINISQDLGATGLGPWVPHGIVRSGARRTVGPRKCPASLQGNRPAPTWKHGSTWKSLSCQTKSRGLQRSLAALSSQAGLGLLDLTPPLAAPARPEMWALDSADFSLLISPRLPSKASKRPVVGALCLSRHLKTRAIRGWKLGATQTTSCLAAAPIQSCQYCGTKERSAQASGETPQQGRNPTGLWPGAQRPTRPPAQPTADSRLCPGPCVCQPLYPERLRLSNAW